MRRIGDIRLAAAEYFGVSEIDILSNRRDRFTVSARRVSMALARSILRWSYREIALAHGQIHPAALEAAHAILQRPELHMAFGNLHTDLSSQEELRLAA